MNKVLKEPLFHFLLLGIALFLVYGLVTNELDDEDTIVIDNFDIDNIIASWEMQWKRLPTDEELKSLIQQNIKQEIFYQEAIKMNLDHNDEIIKRRLSQKMQFLSSDIANMNEPNDKELKDFYQENLDAYMSPYSYEMYQIIFSPDRRDDPKTDAQTTLEKIEKQDPVSAKNLGDNMPFPFYFEAVDENELNRQLGMEFSKELEKIETDQWSGPVKSGFGYHLVYIVKKVTPSPIEFETIKAEVLRDLEYQNQQRMNELIYNEFRKNYTIEYDLDPKKFDESFIEYLNDKTLN